MKIVQTKDDFIDSLQRKIESLPHHEIFGLIVGISGLLIKIYLKNNTVQIGGRCTIYLSSDEAAIVLAEVVGFQDEHVLVMPFGSLYGIKPGCKVVFHDGSPVVYPSHFWCGRVINALAEPIDDKGDLHVGSTPYAIHGVPPKASKRARITETLDVGIRSVNTFLTCCKGQRMGIFAGSGVGKSMLLSMFARFTECDICVIGLIGERGREVNEFLEETLGPDGLRKSVVVVATSDESPLSRRQAAYLAITIAEYFRDLGLSVLCLLDSVTRFAMAQREIGLSAGEPPTTKGYPPSVFTQLPSLLERAGPGIISDSGDTGFVTGLFTVLVDGDDNNEPIADAVRGILDGHIVLERSIAEQGRFPAINILKSISRTVPGCHTDEQQIIVNSARKIISSFEDIQDMVKLGAYKFGSNSDVDFAIQKMPSIQKFLSQKPNEFTTINASFTSLSNATREF